MKIIQDFISPKKEYQQARIAHWNRVALKHDRQLGLGNWYHRRLEEVYRFLVGPGYRVLEIGCGTGNLLNLLKPSQGIGIDFSPEMLQRARKQYPHLEFVEADAHDLTSLSGPFDVIIFSDIVNDLWDVQGAFE